MQATATVPLAGTAANVITLPRRLPALGDTTSPEAIRLHTGAANALAAALQLLRDPACTTADLERATARACRAATLLKRACAAQTEGGAA